MKKVVKKPLIVHSEIIRDLGTRVRALQAHEVRRVAGASFATCPPTIGQACLTLRTCIGHAGCTGS
jgi:hypothetical protein